MKSCKHEQSIDYVFIPRTQRNPVNNIGKTDNIDLLYNVEITKYFLSKRKLRSKMPVFKICIFIHGSIKRAYVVVITSPSPL